MPADRGPVVLDCRGALLDLSLNLFRPPLLFYPPAPGLHPPDEPGAFSPLFRDS